MKNFFLHICKFYLKWQHKTNERNYIKYSAKFFLFFSYFRQKSLINFNFYNYFVTLMRHNLETHVLQSQKLQEYVKFHNKAPRLALNHQVSSAKQQYLFEKERELSTRRQKLSELLSQENRQFTQELWEKDSKPAILKTNLLERIEKMREMKEKHRTAFVEAQKERVFQRDDLEMRKIQREREKIASFRTLQGQIIENQSNLLREYEENQIFAEFAERNRKKEEDHERVKLKENNEKIQRNKQILELQMVIY